MGGRLRPWIAAGAGLAVAVTAACADAQHHGDAQPRVVQVRGAARHWIAGWIASPEVPETGTAFAQGFDDATIRNILYTSAGGTHARVRFDNTFGSRGLVIGAAAIGVVAHGAAVAPGTSVTLTFAGQRSTVIPPGGQRLSDPIRMAVRPLESLEVSVFVPEATGPPTQHTDAHQTNYLARGDRVLAASATAFGRHLGSWYFISGVDVAGSSGVRAALVALGDSITNGNGSVTGANRRWPNDVARRLERRRGGGALSVVDAGIEGNRVLNASPCCGRSALTRFAPDVLGQAGVREVILLEGINDIGFSETNSPSSAPHTDVSAQQIIAGYQQLIERAHAAGLKIFGATLTPFEGSQHWSAAGEAKREAINAWIRGSGAFDGVIDFARAVADPAHPRRLNPRFDDGDHLHPDDAGYQAMANAVNLAMLLRGL